MSWKRILVTAGGLVSWGVFAVSLLAGAVAGADPTEPSTWEEPDYDDAGELPGTAQIPRGTGALTMITGDVTDDVADMYLIYINDPAAFSACTAAHCGGSVGDPLFDTQLWLFDFDGYGVVANDNTLSATPIQSQLLPTATDDSGSAVTSPGYYYLAISQAPSSPRNSDGFIFALLNPVEVSGPDGPGGDSPVTCFMATNKTLGTYSIALTGVQYNQRACCCGEYDEACMPWTIEPQCTLLGGTWRDDLEDRDCVPNPCVAACCALPSPHAPCEDHSQEYCDTNEGEFLTGESCLTDPDLCRGACCWDNATTWCEEVPSETVCTDSDGVWKGRGSRCPKLNWEMARAAQHGIISASQLCALGRSKPATRSNGAPVDPWVTATPDSFGDPPPDEAYTYHDIGTDIDNPPIPGGFFDDGSDPWSGRIYLKGVPLDDPGTSPFGYADTLVTRSGDPFDRCDAPSDGSVTVSVDLSALSLASTDPITVTYNGGSDELWDVVVAPSTLASAPTGYLTAVKEHCNGGTYTARLFVIPKVEFTRRGDGTVRTLDMGNDAWGYEPLEFETPPLDDPDALPWVHDADPRWPWALDLTSAFHAGVAPKFEACADFDTDGDTDFDDYDFIVNLIETATYDQRADLNGDGVIDEVDFEQFECCFQCFTGRQQDVICDIPTLSQWGLAIMLVLLLTGGTLVLRRRRVATG